MGRKPNCQRSDLTPKSQPQKAKERNEEYIKYRSWIRSKAFKENVKRVVEERDGGKCVCCSRTRQNGITLSCHHRAYRHLYEGGEAEAADCITLCSICHKAIHSARKNYEWFSMKNPRNNPENGATNNEQENG